MTRKGPRPDGMKYTGNVYFCLQIPAALSPEPIRYDSVRYIIAKIGKHTVTDWSVDSIVWRWGGGYPVWTLFICPLHWQLCLCVSVIAQRHQENGRIVKWILTIFLPNRYRFTVQGNYSRWISAFGDGGFQHLVISCVSLRKKQIYH
jgi:hypothetical protein